MMRLAIVGLMWATLAVTFAAAHAAEKDDGVDHLSQGRKLLDQGNTDAAIAAFQKAAAQDPKEGAVYLNLGAAYERANRTDDAISAYRKSVELDPKNVYAHNNLGVLLDQKGAYDQAIAAFENAVKSEPGNAMAKKNLDTAKKNKAALKERENEALRAEKEAQAKPDDPQLAYNVSRIYAHYGKPEQAIQWLQKAVTLGFKDVKYIKSDPAFASLKDDREFQLLTLKK